MIDPGGKHMIADTPADAGAGLLGGQVAMAGPFRYAVRSLSDSFSYLGFAVVDIIVLC